MRKQLLKTAAAASDVQSVALGTTRCSTRHAPLRWPSSSVSCASLRVVSTTSSGSATARVAWCATPMRESVRAFHHTTPVCLKISDIGNSASLRSSSSSSGLADDTVADNVPVAASSSPTISATASARKTRKRSISTSTARSAASDAGPATPKKRGRKPASAQNVAASTTAPITATPRTTRKTSGTAKQRTLTASQDPVVASPQPLSATTGLMSSSRPPRSTGNPHCITKRPRTVSATRARAPVEPVRTAVVRTSSVSSPSPSQPQMRPATTALYATPAAASASLQPSLRRTPPTSVTPFVYYTNSAVAETAALSDEAVVAERASLTKLFMVSDSVASIFCVLTHDDQSITNYLDDVDRAAHSPDRASTDDAHTASEGRAEDKEEAAARRTVQATDLQSRVLVEERANHTLCIHIRDMEQLVAPPELLSNAPPTVPAPPASIPVPDPSAKGTTKARRGKGKGAAQKKGKLGLVTPDLPDGTPAPAPVAPALSPLERLLALRHWQRLALEKARLSQQRWVVPDDYHAITRVRFHDPHKADLTLVQGAGGSKSVDDVLEAMTRQLGPGSEGAMPAAAASSTASALDAGDEEALDELGLFDTTELYHCHTDAVVAPAPTDALGGAIAMTAPYALKPLLTVYASSIPRREPLFGIRTDQRQFLLRLSAEEDAHDQEADGAEGHTHDDVLDASAATTHGLPMKDSHVSPPSTTPATSTGLPRRSSDFDASSQVSAFSANPITEDEAYAMVQQYVRVPPMPRFVTRITLLVEHSELEPVDLLSIAEVTTARKSRAARSTVETSVSSSPAHAHTTADAAPGHTGASYRSLEPFVPAAPRIYCLIIDGGDV